MTIRNLPKIKRNTGIITLYVGGKLVDYGIESKWELYEKLGYAGFKVSRRLPIHSKAIREFKRLYNTLDDIQKKQYEYEERKYMSLCREMDVYDKLCIIKKFFYRWYKI